MEVPLYIFDDMAPDGCCCMAMTGFDSATLAYVWNAYRSKLDVSNNKPSWFTCRRGLKYSFTVIRFFLVYVYIHLYPRGKNMPLILRVRGRPRGYDKSTFRRQILPLAFDLAKALDEVQWSDRLDPFNHHPFFPTGFTTIWDTAPIYVATPRDSAINRLLYQPKYKNCVFKLQIAITFRCQIVYFSALHLGTAHDGLIFRNTADEHPFLPWEWGLADKIYQAEKQLLISCRKPRNGELSLEQQAASSKLDTARSSVARV